ncbi:MAG: LacI family DNA-binding transcriptional regulator [Ilumatobacteraceae bacterium]
MAVTRSSRSKTATIADVARRANVSPATVSRVLNGTTAVASDKERRVRKAVADLKYAPFGPARALRQQRVAVWAVIIADVENPFFTSVVRGIEDVAYANGYRLILCNSDEDVAKEADYVDIAIRERLAGVVIAVTSTTGSRVDRLIEEGIPVVAIDRRLTDHTVDTVLVDNRAGAREATRHLLDSGCRRIACIVGPARISTSNERLEGYRDALAEEGVRFERALVRRADFRVEGGYKAARVLLDASPRPDAFFVANNLMTLGALRAIQDVGARIPEDIGVVGFDDSPSADLMRPQMSVVAQPTYEIGRVAAELLVDRRRDEPPQDIVLSPQLIVRESSLHPT